MNPEQPKLETSGVEMHPENDVPEVAAVEEVEQEPIGTEESKLGTPERTPLAQGKENVEVSKLKKELELEKGKRRKLEGKVGKLEKSNKALEAGYGPYKSCL